MSSEIKKHMYFYAGLPRSTHVNVRQCNRSFLWTYFCIQRSFAFIRVVRIIWDRRTIPLLRERFDWMIYHQLPDRCTTQQPRLDHNLSNKPYYLTGILRPCGKIICQHSKTLLTSLCTEVFSRSLTANYKFIPVHCDSALQWSPYQTVPSLGQPWPALDRT